VSLLERLRLARQSDRGPRVRAYLYLEALTHSLGRFGVVAFHLLRAGAILVFDALTWIRYRQPGLKKYQLLFVKPEEVIWGYQQAPPHHFGAVSRKSLESELVPVREALGGTPARCVMRVKENKSWEETGEFVFFWSKSKSRTRDPNRVASNMVNRYKALDQLVESLKVDGKLKTRREIDEHPFREKGGIGIIIHESGDIALCDGHHRFGIALGLDLNEIPVSLHSVDPKFVLSGAWREFFQQHRFRAAI